MAGSLPIIGELKWFLYFVCEDAPLAKKNSQRELVGEGAVWWGFVQTNTGCTCSLSSLCTTWLDLCRSVLGKESLSQPRFKGGARLHIVVAGVAEGL